MQKSDGKGRKPVSFYTAQLQHIFLFAIKFPEKYEAYTVHAYAMNFMRGSWMMMKHG